MAGESAIAPLASLFDAAASVAQTRRQRDEGVAFLRAAQDLHGATSLAYAAFNIPAPGERNLFTHCLYSDAYLRHAVGPRIEPCEPATSDAIANGECVLRLRTTMGESAFLAVAFDEGSSPSIAQIDELRSLGGYFHAHVCRINGCTAVREDLSARERDCLQWTAAGKTAWEAGVILGLTERTVRFHLNMAREKLKCATTAQAVAKAVASGVITA